MKIIKAINKNQYYDVLVDDEDYDLLSKQSWFRIKNNYITGNRKRKTVLIHRIIMNATCYQKVDHIDGNPLNNQKSNLRICTQIENVRNQKIRKNNTSGYKGVTFKRRMIKNKEYSYWCARLGFNNKRIHLGYFKTQIDAAKAYNIAAIKYFGEFAKLNEIKDE